VIVLALNCGSSSLKFQVFAHDPGASPRDARRLARGVVERIGDEATLAFQGEGRSATREREPVPDHEAAVRRVLGWLAAGGASEHEGATRVDAVGHRVVHGGARFTKSVLIDADVLGAIEAVEALAPLHNAPSLAGIRAARAALGPDVPMIAAFDRDLPLTECDATFLIADLAGFTALTEIHGSRYAAWVNRSAIFRARCSSRWPGLP
jgi:acetate kinase